MIISHGRRYIFVHIPKTGGTALALALEARAMKDDILIGDTPKARRRRNRVKSLNGSGRIWKHSTLADIEGIVTRDEMAAFLTFTLVRNPWDRLVSYYHWLRAQRFDHPAVALASACTFTEFLNHPVTQGALAANGYDSYMRDASGSLHDPVYLRLEHLETDLAPVRAHLGFDLRPGRENVSLRDRDWRIYYSDSDADLVSRLCAEDIARFGYEFGG